MKSWFSIRAQTATEPAEVSIYGDIGSWGINAASFIDQVKAVQGPIRVRINSGGGEVFDGLAIYNYLAGRGNVETVIDGLAASAASLPFLAGSKRLMPKAAFLMIHNPWSGTVGGAEDMRKAAEVLDRIGAGLANVYARVTGMTVEAVQALMDAETWLDGDAALAGKWATEVVDLGPVKASVRRGRYARTPAAIVAAAPGDLAVGDYVELSYGDGTTKGEVVEVLTTGTASGADGAVDATAEDPAALVDVLREAGTTGDFEETDVQVARLFSTLTKADAPRIVEVEEPEAKAKISASTNAGNRTKMNATDRILAILRVKKGAEDTFLASAIEALGIPADAVQDARRAGTTGFLVDNIKARIDEFEATAKAATDRANAILATVGIDANAPDLTAAVKAKLDELAAKKAAEILASKGIKHDVGNAAAATGAASSKTNDEIRAEFSKMKPGQERTAFFNKHKAVLIS